MVIIDTPKTTPHKATTALKVVLWILLVLVYIFFFMVWIDEIATRNVVIQVQSWPKPVVQGTEVKEFGDQK